ncbi:hypothetical protein [Microbacterium sp. PM5]|uniref:hypothetical protein n=1 Tax=Microbacterium sp. PM5 TaxID=2014534 RepID=UPI000DD0F132|nr:hypothetical protein [Microbacterium sp. PM5]AXA97621.1 hypothetical protein CEP17_14990 [Microbacterium sp. PM5]
MIVQDPRPDARPDWDDLTDAEHEQHRAKCGPANGGPCPLCEEHREFGGCSSCGDTSAEIANDITLCCGVRGLQGVEFDRWAAA